MTLIPVVLLFIFGSGSLKDFAFALIVGIASGAYSSIFIASPLLAILLAREPQFRGRGAEARPAEPAVRTSMAAPEPVVAGDAPAPDTPSRRRRARPHGRPR